MNKHAHNFALFAAFVSLISACAQAKSSEIVIVTTEDFVARIRDAGFEAVEAGLVENTALENEGQILEWDSIHVEVYEFADSQSRSAVSDGINQADMTRNGIPIVPIGFATVWAKGSIIVVYPGLDGGTIMLLNGLLGDPLSYEAEAAEEPFPPAVVAAIRYVAEQRGIDPGLVQVEGYEQVDWANGCLELAEPDEACAEVITPGWRIEIRADDLVLEIRTDLSGATLRSANDGQ